MRMLAGRERGMHACARVHLTSLRNSPSTVFPSARSLAFSLLVLSGASCAVVKYPAPAARLEALKRNPAVTDYRIGPGDELEVKFFYTPELTTVAVVRADGSINLPLVGDVKVAESTPRELAARLQAEYLKHLQRPEVAINVRTFASQRVFVGGQVGRPGMQPLVGRVSVLQAVLAADGFKDDAR